MFESHVLEIAGRVAGAAVTATPFGAQRPSLRFIAIDPRLEEIDGSDWPDLAALRHAAGHLLQTGSLPRKDPVRF